MKTMPLTQGYEAIVDEIDYPDVSRWKWYALVKRRRSKEVRTVYAVRGTYMNGKQTKIWLHRYMLQLTDPHIECDHRDGNGLNNQRENLRIATHVQNNRNRRKCLHTSSRFKGVSWYRPARVWQAHITKGGKVKNLGCFANEIDAAMAYNIAATQHFGEYALLNDLS